MRVSSFYVVRLLLFAFLLMPASAGTVVVAAPSFAEYELKAGFIYKFLSFVSWPDDQPDDGTITIAILGKNPFGDAFKALEGRTIGSRVVKIKSFSRDADYEEFKSCQVIYISASEEKRLKDIFKAIGNSSILTIGDSKKFVDKGGMIGFVKKQKKRIGIEINNVAVTRANLEIRSMLKRIAVRIIDTPADEKKGSHDDTKR